MIISEIFHYGGNYYTAVYVNIFLMNSHLPAHADNESLMGNQPNIVSLSIGATRTFRVIDPEEHFIDIELVNGAIVQMSGNLQLKYKHAVLKTKFYDGPWVNFTFRHVKHHTCHDTANLVKDITKHGLRELLPHQLKFFHS